MVGQDHPGLHYVFFYFVLMVDLVQLLWLVVSAPSDGTQFTNHSGNEVVVQPVDATPKVEVPPVFVVSQPTFAQLVVA